MADGLNQIRAMRIQEIMNDYRELQQYVAGIRANPSAEEYNEEGFVVLRRCFTDSQTLLQQPFSAAPTGLNGDPEQNKTQLQRILVDASVRRFKARRIYFKATAALRWVNTRTQILQGRSPSAAHAPALQQATSVLRQEFASVTDERVYTSLRAADTAAGKWMVEDPALPLVQRLASNGNGR